MNNADKMIDMIAEACKTALGEEWNAMSDTQKYETIMSFIATAAHKASKGE